MTTTNSHQSPHRRAAIVYGVLFLLSFLSYGTGSSLVAELADSPQGLEAVADSTPLFVFGIVLMAVVHTFTNIGLAVVMFTILKPFNQIVAFGYVSAAVTATIIATVGALFMLLLVPLSEAFLVSSSEPIYLDSLASLLKKGGFYGYQLSMTIWGIGGILFCYLLSISKLVPRVFPVWGIIGYLVFMVGTLGEMFGYSIGLALSAPGGLFEVSLSLWLNIRGFNRPKLV